MSAPAKLGLYALVLAAVLVVALAIGGVAGPVDVGGSSDGDTHQRTGFGGHEGQHP